MDRILLFTTFLAINRASSFNCSVTELPLSSGSGTVNFTKAINVEYCIIDNCTILRNDNGQRLDIIYTNENLLVVTLKDNLTATVIAKSLSEAPCLSVRTSLAPIPTSQFVILMVNAILLVIVSGCNLIIHLLFKKLKHLLKTLMLLYSFSIAIRFIVFVFLLLTSYTIAMNLQSMCHATVIMFMVSSIITEAFATCILIHLTYMIYCSYKMLQVSELKNKSLFGWYMALVACIVLSSIGLITLFDFLTDSGEHTMLSNGYCTPYYHNYTYKTIILLNVICGMLKTVQIVSFTIYLFYFNKLKIDCYSTENRAIKRHNHASLVKLAIIMAATIGLSYFIWLLNSPLAGISGMVFLFIQQSIIVTSFLKMSRLCRKYPGRENADQSTNGHQRYHVYML